MPASSSNKKTAVKPTPPLPKKKSKAPPVPVCVFLDFPQITCTSCDQNTHSVDKDSLTGSFLHWVKRTRAGAPYSTECYACGRTRVRFFPTYAQEALDKACKEHPEVDERRATRRRDIVQGSSKHQRAQPENVEDIIEKKKKEFSENFTEGTLQPIREFLKERKYRDVDQMDDDDAVALIQERFDYDIVQDKRDGLCVEIPDMQHGKKRFRRGEAEEVTRAKKIDQDATTAKDAAELMRLRLREKSTPVHAAREGASGTPRLAEASDGDEDEDDKLSEDGVPGRIFVGDDRHATPRKKKGPESESEIATPRARDLQSCGAASATKVAGEGFLTDSLEP